MRWHWCCGYEYRFLLSVLAIWSFIRVLWDVPRGCWGAERAAVEGWGRSSWGWPALCGRCSWVSAGSPASDADDGGRWPAVADLFTVLVGWTSIPASECVVLVAAAAPGFVLGQGALGSMVSTRLSRLAATTCISQLLVESWGAGVLSVVRPDCVFEHGGIVRPRHWVVVVRGGSIPRMPGV